MTSENGKCRMLISSLAKSDIGSDTLHLPIFGEVEFKEEAFDAYGFD